MTTNDFSMQELQIGGGLDLIRGQSVNLDEAWALISTCSEWLRDIGMDHWDKYYTRKMVEEKIKGQELYLAYREGELVGTVTLDTNPVSYYEPNDLETFEDPKAEAMYVTALAVYPDMQKQGIAGNLMKFAEESAKERNIPYIRFDCRESYGELVEFYKKRGYGVVGRFTDPSDNDEPYLLMEKKINE